MLTSDNQSCETKDQELSILYIEDNQNNLRLVSRAIVQFKVGTLLQATNAEDGLELAQNNIPDVILMDISLPGMDGYAALSKLRKTDATKHIPVLAVTAYAHPDEIESGLNAGFNRYITKPVNIGKLIDTIKQVTSL
jgi:CheY-like chemotaxis protein